MIRGRSHPDHNNKRITNLKGNSYFECEPSLSLTNFKSRRKHIYLGSDLNKKQQMFSSGK